MRFNGPSPYSPICVAIAASEAGLGASRCSPTHGATLISFYGWIMAARYFDGT
jgi:hypothetical protein